jgi:hypothetical protein
VGEQSKLQRVPDRFVGLNAIAVTDIWSMHLMCVCRSSCGTAIIRKKKRAFKIQRRQRGIKMLRLHPIVIST